MESSTPSAIPSPFSLEKMMTDLQTLTHRLAIEESQQRQIDSIQDNTNFFDQLTKEDDTATAVFAETQTSSVVNTAVAADQSPLLFPPTPSSSSSPSSSSASASAASRPTADTLKNTLVQPPITTMIKSSIPNSTTSTNPATTSAKKPSATPECTKKPPPKTTTKTSSKLTKQSQNTSIQSCPSPKVQIRLDRFLVSRKPSLASTTKPAADSETKTPAESILKCTTTGSNTSKQPSASTTRNVVKSTSATSSSTTPKSKSRVRVKIKPATSSPVEKRTITLNKTSRTAPSPPNPRLKANFFFGLLPPPTVTTANRKTDETPRREGDPTTNTSTSTSEESKNALKAEPDAFTTTPPANMNGAMAKLIKVKGLVPDSSDAASTGSTTATGKDVPPTEVTRRVVRSKSSLPELKSTIASTVKIDKPVVPAVSKSTTTPPLATKKKSVPVEISSRVIKIKSSAPESKFRPSNATPIGTTTPAPKAMTTPKTASLKTVSKPTKVPCLSKNTATETAVSKTKPQPSPVSKSVVTPTARSKKSSDTVPPSSTKNTTAATTEAAVVPETKAASKGASTASKSPSKDSVILKSPKPLSTTTIATTTAVSQDGSTVPKPSKNLTISTSASKNNKDKVKDKDSLRTTSEVTTATTPAAQPRNPIPPRQPQQPPPPPLQHLATTATTTSIFPLSPNEDIPMDSPSFSPTSLTQTPRRCSFSFKTSPSGIVFSLSTNPHYLQNQNQTCQLAATTATTTTTSSCQPAPALAPASLPPFGSTPPLRPKRVLELMLQSDRDPPNTSLHINEIDSSYYYYLRNHQGPSTFNLLPKNDITSSSSPRPQKRQRLADITAESTAGRNHGMFGQTAFEQALDAMSFKYRTPAHVPGPAHLRGLLPAPATITATASQRLRLFQKRRREASTSTMAVSRRVMASGGGGAPRWIP